MRGGFEIKDFPLTPERKQEARQFVGGVRGAPQEAKEQQHVCKGCASKRECDRFAHGLK